MKTLFIVLLCFALVHCGGEANTAGIDGTGGPKTSVGQVASASDTSVTVNGEQFNINSQTDVVINGQDSQGSELLDGYVAAVESKETAIAATKITVDFNIIGPITALDPAAESFTVLGQTVQVSDQTTFGGLVERYIDLETGDQVQVSGFTLADGTVSATRVDMVVSNDLQIIGIVSNIDNDISQLTINDLIVDYSNISGITLALGDRVIVKATALNAQGQLIATELIRLPTLPIDATGKVELEGFVTEVASDVEFRVNDVEVQIDFQNTEYEGGNSTDLKVDSKVEIEGELNDEGILVASKIRFLAAQLLHFDDGDTLPNSPTVTFEWSDVGADEYKLRIISEYYEGHHLLNQPYPKGTTQATIDGFPPSDVEITVVLMSRFGERWSAIAYTLYGGGNFPSAELTSHSDGHVFDSDVALFTWEDVGADRYVLLLADASGEAFYEQEFVNEYSALVQSLPINDVEMKVILRTYFGGWHFANTYKMTSQALVENARLSSHSEGDTLTAETVTFIWDDVGAEQYRLNLGNGATLLFDGVLGAGITSVTVTNLPTNNANILLRLYSKHNGHWGEHNYRLFSAGQPDENAELTSHEDGGQLKTSTDTFTWTEIPDADSYSLQLIKRVDDHDITFYWEPFNSHITSVIPEGLPKSDAEFRVVLRTERGSLSARKDYRLRGPGELANSRFISHVDREVIRSNSTTFAWEDVGADHYRLAVVDQSGGSEVTIHDEVYDGSVFEQTIDNIPSQSDKLLVFIVTDHGGFWSGVHNRLFLSSDIP